MTIATLINPTSAHNHVFALLLGLCIFLHSMPGHSDAPATPSISENTDPRQEFNHYSPSWLKAVGKLRVPGRIYRSGSLTYQWEDCSATLVGSNSSARADTIVTAWHCLENYRDLSQPILFTLAAGQNPPIQREAYRLFDGGGMYADWAILRLFVPVHSDHATVLPIHPTTAKSGISIAMAGYSRQTALGDFGNRLTFDPMCSITQRSDDVVESDCHAQKGASGGAVVQPGDNGTFWFVGVISEGDGQGISRFVPVDVFRAALKPVQ
ncbi:MAG: trypsin-like peptidase domain-containing protein [Pseudomonadota bacterium]